LCKTLPLVLVHNTTGKMGVWGCLLTLDLVLDCL